MYRSIEDFEADWNYEAQGTLNILRALSDESLSQKVTETGRSLGFIAWHITQTLSEMLGQAGLQFESDATEGAMPETASEIASAYERDSGLVTEVVKTGWTNDELTDEIEMYGQTWKKGIALHALIAHQIHHRGQMTVLMRQAGLKVPGIYGPAKEEWEEMGMPAMD